MAGPPPDPGPVSPGGADKGARVQAAVYEFLSRRSSGEDVSPAAFQAVHGHLMPELADAIAAGLRTLRFVQAGQRAWHGDNPRVGPTVPAASSPLPIIPGYRLRREISRGGQGVVYEAVHEPTDRAVAVKVLTGISRGSATRFDREAEVLAKVDDPGVVTILDRGVTQDGIGYLAVAYIPGSDFDEWLAARRGAEPAPTIKELVAVFAQIASALGAAHAVGVVHRDVKPSNIRMDPSGRPRVIDFGLAHLVDDHGADAKDRQLTRTRDVIGSIAWLSPEQASPGHDPVTPASDVYAAGVMMYEAFVGRFPYPVDLAPLAVLRHICETAPADPRRPGPSGLRVDALLSSVIRKCLAKRPCDRYADGRAVAQDLHAFLSGTLRIPARRRARTMIIRAAAVAAVLLLIGTWAAYRAGWLSAHDMEESLEPRPFRHVTNSVGMNFVELPAGVFGMGSPDGEEGRLDNEQAHRVRLTKPFFMGATEVTRAQYEKVMGTLPAGSSAAPRDWPVNFVSWSDANEFCQKLSAFEDGYSYRLPTEAEWEYACRAGTRWAHCVPAERLGQVAWFAANAGNTLHPVAAKLPNRWGLYDMHGNVAEYTADRFMPHLGTAERRDPSFAIAIGPCVLRGGSVSSKSEDCRSARRDEAPLEIGNSTVGFRVVAEPVAARQEN